MPGNMTDSKKTTPGFGYGLTIDATAAFAASAVGIPFETTKKRYQTGQKVWYGFNKKMLEQTYLGGSAFISSVSITTVAQGFAARGLQHYNNGAQLTFNQKLISAGIGGFFSSFTENVILRQQLLEKHGFESGPMHAIRSLFNQGHSRPWLGLRALIIREAVFGSCYMSAGSVQENYGFLGVLMLAVAGSLTSHPFDRIASEQQNFEIRSPLQAMRNIDRKGGARNFYRGGACRAGLFVVCMTTIANVKGVLENVSSASPSPK